MVTLVVGFALLLMLLFDRDVKLDLSIGGIKTQSVSAVYDIGLIMLAIVWTHLAKLMAEAARLAAAHNIGLATTFSPEASQKGAEVSLSQAVEERSIFLRNGAGSSRLYGLYWVCRVAEHWSAYLFLLAIVLSTAVVLVVEGVNIIRSPSMPMPVALAVGLVLALFLAKGSLSLAQYWLVRRRGLTLDDLFGSDFLDISDLPKSYSMTELLLYVVLLVISIPLALAIAVWNRLVRWTLPWRPASAVDARGILASNEGFWFVGIRSVSVTSIEIASGRRALAGKTIGPVEQAIDICIVSTTGEVQLEASFVPRSFCDDRLEHRVTYSGDFQHAVMGSDPNSYLLFQDTSAMLEGLKDRSFGKDREPVIRQREAEIGRIYEALTSAPMTHGVFLGAKDGGLFSELQERVPAYSYFAESERNHLKFHSLLAKIGVSDRLLERTDLPPKEKAVALLDNVRTIAARWPKAKGKPSEFIAAKVQANESK